MVFPEVENWEAFVKADCGYAVGQNWWYHGEKQYHKIRDDYPQLFNF